MPGAYPYPVAVNAVPRSPERAVSRVASGGIPAVAGVLIPLPIVAVSMPEDVLFESESRQSRGEIASYLRAVADKLDGDGEVSLSAGDQSVSLAVPSQPTFEVKAEHEYPSGGGSGELSLELEIEWPEDAADDSGGPLSVE